MVRCDNNGAQTRIDFYDAGEDQAKQNAAEVASARLRRELGAEGVGDGKAKKLTSIDAAIQVLAKAGEPMNCKAMIDAMLKQGLWTSPGGKTPEATLYSSILRDLRNGKDARFKKVDRGQFALAAKK
jgi:hypothetical protein